MKRLRRGKIAAGTGLKMQMAIVALVIIFLTVFGGMSMAQGYMFTTDTSAAGAVTLSKLEGKLNRTHLELTGATSLFPAGHWRVRLRNRGQTKLNDLAKWDVIVQYSAAGGEQVVWLPYTTGTPGNNQWGKILISAESEGKVLPDVYDPGILNPGEEMLIDLRLDPVPEAGTPATITIATATGWHEDVSLTAGVTMLTTHSETESVAGTDYYLMKEAAGADGTAITESTDAYEIGESGRKLLHKDSDDTMPARHIFHLLELTEIPASTWTAYYRGRTLGDPDFPDADSHVYLSIDILVRQADGSLRQTIATNQAIADITVPETWETLPATYDFPGYTVVDDTDYLEIVYYGSANVSPPSNPAYIQLRVDDGSLPAADQTRIEMQEP
ncbi:MAG: hypothetical protein ABID87_05850 [Chloroflexota bacterium]